MSGKLLPDGFGRCSGAHAGCFFRSNAETVDQVVHSPGHGEHRSCQSSVRQPGLWTFYVHLLTAKAVGTIRQSCRFHCVGDGYSSFSAFAAGNDSHNIIMQMDAVADHLAVKPVIHHGCTRYTG